MVNLPAPLPATWIVEPSTFRMTRSAPRNKFTYQYEIILQTIALVEDVLLIDDPVTLYSKVENAKQILRQVSNDLTRFSTIIGSGMAAAAGTVKEATDALTNTIDTVSSAAGLIADGAKEVFETPDVIKGRVQTTGTVAQRAAIKNMPTALEDFLDARDSVSATSGLDPVSALPTEAGGISVDEAVLSASIAVGRLSGREEFFSRDFPNEWDDILQYYDPSYGFGGYNRNMTDPLNRSGVVEGEILPGDDIIAIAIRELGSAERYQEIVVLNNLKPPYISFDADYRKQNTLAPGDRILLPAGGNTDPARAPVRTTVFTDPTETAPVTSGGALTFTLDLDDDWRVDQWKGFTFEVIGGTGEGQEGKVASNTADSITARTALATALDTTSIVRLFLRRLDVEPIKSAYDQALGVDMKLTRGYDLAKSSTGDISLIDGSDNMQQAIQTKFNTAPGDLPIHVNFGLASEPGRRALPENIIAHRVAVRQTLLSDSRIESVRDLKVQADGDKLSVTATAVTVTGIQPFAVDTLGGK